MKEFYGAELRRRREDAGLSQSGLGDLVFCSGAYIGFLEMAARSPQLDMSEQIDSVLKADGFFRRLCEAILKAAKAKFPGYFAAAAELEQRALTICDFAPMVVPGLLQTPAYTRALIQTVRPRIDAEESERRVEARQERARSLLQNSAEPELWFILHEAVLRVVVGDNWVMREQLEHIAKVARSDQAVVQVMPFSGVGVNPLMYGTMKVMTFAEEPSVVYTETAFAGQLIEDPALVVSYSRSYDRARADALSPEASLAFIEGLLAKEYSP